MNAVGIDVSKGKSTVVIIQPFGVIIAEPFDVPHTTEALNSLVQTIKALPGDTKILMEYTGVYYEPIAKALHENGLFVSVVNPIIIENYSINSVRKIKTDKKDAFRIANFALDKWLDLVEYIPADDLRKTLKNYNRQYIQTNKILIMQKNNLIALLDSSFPGANNLFTSPKRNSDGHEKWIDFVIEFPHLDSVGKLSLSVFKRKYNSWCKKHNYNYSDEKASEIHHYSRTMFASVSFSEFNTKLIQSAGNMILSTLEALAALRSEMKAVSERLPEYDIVMDMFGVGPVLGPQLIAEIGDIRRLRSSKSAVALAGIDPPPNQSGMSDQVSRRISKRGSPSLRKTLFQIMTVILQQKPDDNPVYEFMIKKRNEGKPYRVYMIAAAHKFLRIYYARVRESLTAQGLFLDSEPEG